MAMTAATAAIAAVAGARDVSRLEPLVCLYIHYTKVFYNSDNVADLTYGYHHTPPSRCDSATLARSFAATTNLCIR